MGQPPKDPQTPQVRAPEPTPSSKSEGLARSVAIIATLLTLIASAIAAYFHFTNDLKELERGINELKDKTTVRTCDLAIKASIARAVNDYLEADAAKKSLPNPATLRTEWEKKQTAVMKTDYCKKKEKAKKRREFYETVETHHSKDCDEIERRVLDVETLEIDAATLAECLKN
jgi:predicted RNase H-like nuclease (RuvC/YqgF family)